MSSESIVDEIKRLREKYMIAQDSGDAEGCVSYWNDDGVLMPPHEPAVVGKAALGKWYREAFEQAKIDFTISFDEIKVEGDWGFARGGYTGKLTPIAGGEAIQDKGKYLEILVRQADGSWKFGRHMWSSDNPQ